MALGPQPGLREVLLIIERSGHLDLRALLEENVLGGLLDELIERASQHSATSLRASAQRPKSQRNGSTVSCM